MISALMLAVTSGLHCDFASIWNEGLFVQAGEKEEFPLILDKRQVLVLPHNKTPYGTERELQGMEEKRKVCQCYL